MKQGNTPTSMGRMLSMVWKAFKELNPKNVETEAARRIRIGVVGPRELLQETIDYLLRDDIAAYQQAEDILLLISTPLQHEAMSLLGECDIVLRYGTTKDDLVAIDPKRIFLFSSTTDIPNVVRSILQSPDLGYIHLPLARALPAVRDDVASEIIRTISIENALFVVSTSFGNIIPNPLQVLASVAESAGDLVVLTANQVRMLFRLAAAFDKDLNYKQIYPEVLSILGAAFGWRTIARELVGKIPFGGGVVPKAAIAFAGTLAVGDGIVFYYTTGKRMTKEQMKERFDVGLEKGKATGAEIVGKFKDAYTKGISFMNKPGDESG